MARRRFSSMPRVKRRQNPTGWPARAAKALVLEPGEGTPQQCGSVPAGGVNQILS